MELHILSDLHLEMGNYTPTVPAADLVILAGDIHKGAQAVRWAFREYPQLPVLLVPGNHEYYGSRRLLCEGAPDLLFTENETNTRRLYGDPDGSPVCEGQHQ